MPLSLNKPRLDNLAGEIWKSAQRLRGKFKAYEYLLAKFVKSCYFLRCFFSYSYPIQEFAEFAEAVGPQLIKTGTVSEMMKLVRATQVIRSKVIDQGEVSATGSTQKPKPRTGGGGGGPPLRRVSIDEMIARFLVQYQITEEEALVIRQVTEEKAGDSSIRDTVLAHSDDAIYLEETYRGQINQMIRGRYGELGRYEDLVDEKYIDDGAIFDIMAITVIDHHWPSAMPTPEP